ncbi:MAG: zinc ribbon domain-containing protein [Rhodoferax sp.]|nr:zinc ribbon domain-containing protein [Rhodoferax sp.]
MPTYDYACPNCGTFAARQSMALYDQPLPCPNCTTLSPRGLSVPLSLSIGRLVTSSRFAADTSNSVDIDGGYKRLRHPRACACCH